jgi:hypothetical protein
MREGLRDGGFPVRYGDATRVGFCLCALASCTSHLRHATYTPQPTSALVEVIRPPPPARVEMVPTPPNAAAVWVDGEWTWRRQRWAWTPGRWVVQPPHASFSPWVFVRAPDGTFWYAPGVWRGEKGEPLDAPQALAVATVEGSEVLNADGTKESTGPILRPGRLKSSTPPAPPTPPGSPASLPPPSN